MSAAVRLGVFGGTFDPPHLGHLIAAADAQHALELDRVVWVPAAAPPHKLGCVRGTAEQRLEMVRAAVSDDDRFAVDDLELRRSGPSFTVDTLRSFHERYPSGEIFFLLGLDALREIDSWRAPHEVARLAHLVGLSRGGDATHLSAAFPARLVSVTRIDISATEIRRRVGAGQSIRYLVPDPVRKIIRRERLYVM